MNEEMPPLEDFSGTARLFPLPNLVLYPHVLQPLHIFEPRYRQMTRDALDDDRLLALALLQPGWEKDYEGKPPIYPTVCLARIVAEQKLGDGRYNLLVQGVRRARITTEPETEKLYRLAELELLEEIACNDCQQEMTFRQQFKDIVPHWFTSQTSVRSQFEKLTRDDIALGILCDIFAFTLPLLLQFKQLLLEEVDVVRRCRVLLEQLQRKKEQTFPPDFSAN